MRITENMKKEIYYCIKFVGNTPYCNNECGLSLYSGYSERTVKAVCNKLEKENKIHYEKYIGYVINE